MREKKKKKKCNHSFVLSGKYFGLVSCPYCRCYFTKKIPAYWEETRKQDEWIEVKLLTPKPPIKR